MSDGSCILTAGESFVADFLDRAQRRVVFMAPGVSEPVAEALLRAVARLGAANVDVIVDLNADVYRLGYGTQDGLNALQSGINFAGLQLRHEPGVRIGLVVADDATLVYSPTPQLVEAEPETPGRPNAILLGTPPSALADDLGMGTQAVLMRAVGMDAALPGQVDAIREDLKRNKPAKFDLARRVRVYSNYFQFVDFELTGVLISRKKVPVPASLIGMENRAELEHRFHAQYTVVGDVDLRVQVGDNKWLDERTLRRRKDKIVEDFLVPLKGYGRVLQNANKEEFLIAVESLRGDVEKFKQGVGVSLGEAMEEAAQGLAEALLPVAEKNPPRAYQKVHGPHISRAQLRELMVRDIKSVFGSAEELVNGMEVRVTFKDIAYESLKDEEFLAVARRAIPGLESIHTEGDAVPAEESE